MGLSRGIRAARPRGRHLRLRQPGSRRAGSCGRSLPGGPCAGRAGQRALRPDDPGGLRPAGSVGLQGSAPARRGASGGHRDGDRGGQYARERALRAGRALPAGGCGRVCPAGCEAVRDAPLCGHVRAPGAGRPRALLSAGDRSAAVDRSCAGGLRVPPRRRGRAPRPLRCGGRHRGADGARGGAAGGPPDRGRPLEGQPGSRGVRDYSRGPGFRARAAAVRPQPVRAPSRPIIAGVIPSTGSPRASTSTAT